MMQDFFFIICVLLRRRDKLDFFFQETRSNDINETLFLFNNKYSSRFEREEGKREEGQEKLNVLFGKSFETNKMLSGYRRNQTSVVMSWKKAFT